MSGKTLLIIFIVSLMIISFVLLLLLLFYLGRNRSDEENEENEDEENEDEENEDEENEEIVRLNMEIPGTIYNAGFLRFVPIEKTEGPIFLPEEPLIEKSSFIYYRLFGSDLLWFFRRGKYKIRYRSNINTDIYLDDSQIYQYNNLNEYQEIANIEIKDFETILLRTCVNTTGFQFQSFTIFRDIEITLTEMFQFPVEIRFDLKDLLQFLYFSEVKCIIFPVEENLLV